MNARLRQAWQARTAGERTIIAILAVIFAGALYLALLQSGQGARGRLQANVATLQLQAVAVAQQAAELERLRAIPLLPAAQTDLRTLVEAQAGAAGLSRALTRIDAPDAKRVVVVFGAIGFADWLRLVENLGARQVRLDNCQIEAQTVPGLVGVTATLVWARAP